MKPESYRYNMGRSGLDQGEGKEVGMWVETIQVWETEVQSGMRELRQVGACPESWCNEGRAPGEHVLLDTL